MMRSVSVFALVSLLTSSAEAFAPKALLSHQRIGTVNLQATVQKSELVPPVMDAAATSHTQDIYNEHVQTTYGRYPLTISHGKGCWLYTLDGKKYLDFCAGIATCALGHSNEDLTNAITKQMQTVHHVSNLYYIPQQAQLAQWLCDNSVADKVFFCNSGAEANEAAIKLARRNASNKGITDPVIISAINSFHGRTLAALTATAQPKYHKGFGYGGKMVPGFEYAEYNNIADLERVVAEVNGPSDLPEGRKRAVAAIILESLQGEGGVIPATKEFLTRARQLCDESNALLICDEVQVGMGRSGMLWGYQNLDVEPDVFTSAKALGGGVPIGAMMARGEAATVFGPGDHASTYGGNPLACAAGLAVAKYYSDHDILRNVRERSQQLITGLDKIASRHPDILGGVRGWGLLLGIVIKDEALMASNVVQAAMEKGLLLVPAGPKVVRFVPPLVVSQDEIDKALEMFEQAVISAAAALKK